MPTWVKVAIDVNFGLRPPASRLAICVADVLLSKGQKVRVIGRDKGRLQR
jgi:hypothetical protein